MNIQIKKVLCDTEGTGTIVTLLENPFQLNNI